MTLRRAVWITARFVLVSSTHWAVAFAAVMLVDFGCCTGDDASVRQCVLEQRRTFWNGLAIAMAYYGLGVAIVAGRSADV